ncbi:MAG: CHAT domain-containing protein [Moorea sp. SIO1F2]|uniref:CHAT domain-containing protein n=1 Tax=Moorena sp. SIO1F2 TaxID=2607819 RepID=UPI0013BDFCD0|nr:CHAT domain-containing tetratricopeptide repeat protein [Moorena sp. SIO1F2]NET83797.1 CHAT domain-containing protein [Moorena sp. SIO1F2]
MADNTSDTQLNFLLEVLQATADSRGDAQVVYPLLAENTDKINHKLAEQLRDWATSKLAEAEANEAKSLAAVIGNFSNLIREFPLGDKASTIEIAITGYDVVLTVFTREAFPIQWALTKKYIGNAYCDRIKGEKAQNIEHAIACFQQALIVTFEAFPIEWARTQYNLGIAYNNRIIGQKAQNIEETIACYQQALTVYTFEAFPIEWAKTQYNLGNAYRDRIKGEKAQNIEQAIACFQQALIILTFEAFPDEWVNTQDNLGIAYYSRIKGEKAQNIENAIACSKKALRVFTFEGFPEGWARTQYNLGNAYRNRIKGQKSQNSEEAIACYQQALRVFTFEGFPEGWAKTQNNLGAAYRNRIKGEKAQKIEEAIACYQQALRVLTFEAFPYDWASTQNNLGIAYCNRIKGEKAQNIEEAIACYQQALRVYTFEAFPDEWAQTQNNLGIDYCCNRIKGEKAQNIEEAIACYQQALRVYTFEAFPYEWASTQTNIGNAYYSRIKGDKSQNIEEAIACYQEALRVRTFEGFPIEWAQTQNNLGNAYSDRIKGEKSQNREEDIACLQQALRVFTFEAFPIEWATTQTHLGGAYSNRIVGQKAQNLEKAIACFQLALEVRTRDAFPEEHAETLYGLGIAYQDSKQSLLAYTTFNSAIATVESLQEEMVYGEESKRKHREKWNKLYSIMVEVCVDLDKITEALDYAEQSKNRYIVEEIISRELKSIFPANIVTQLKEYRDEIARGQNQIQDGKAENPTALAKRLQALRQQHNQVKNHYLPIGSGFQFEHFQNKLDNHTAIVEFYITRNKLVTFVFTRNLVWHSQLKDLGQLVDWANGYLKAYSTKKYHYPKHLTTRLHSLAQILHIDDIIQQIPPECDRLILIPHQYLHLLPLHALPINTQQGEGNSKILMDRFPAGVSYAPSCQLLQLTQTRQRPEEFPHLFAVQNPSGDLVYTPMEVEVIQSYFNPPPDTEVLVENAATKAAIDSNPLNSYHCLHFSCHGYFNYQEPRKSALILANAQPTSAEPNPERYLRVEDEKYDLEKCLTIDDVFELKLEQCRLVTLSACETGLIDFNNISDEYIGLPSGFLVAGSPAVVSSLWKVNDLSTALLMIKFYQNLREQIPLAVALNQAQLWLRDSTKAELEDYINNLPLNLVDQYVIKAKFHNFNSSDKPFEAPFHWAAFFAIGK